MQEDNLEEQMVVEESIRAAHREEEAEYHLVRTPSTLFVRTACVHSCMPRRNVRSGVVNDRVAKAHGSQGSISIQL
jgi:hypothetical protein